jgi:hypothetical protein
LKAEKISWIASPIGVGGHRLGEVGLLDILGRYRREKAEDREALRVGRIVATGR